MYKFGFIYHFSYSKIKASDQLTSIIKPLIAAPQCSIANWDRWDSPCFAFLLQAFSFSNKKKMPKRGKYKKFNCCKT